jgi:hypothetical protein
VLHWILQNLSFSIVVLCQLVLGIVSMTLAAKLSHSRRDLKWQEECRAVMERALERALECSRNKEKKLGLTESALTMWIKDYNLLAEENVCLIRSVKEANQEAALERVCAKFWQNDSNKWRQAWHVREDEKEAQAAALRIAKDFEHDLYGEPIPSSMYIEPGQRWKPDDNSGTGTVIEVLDGGARLKFKEGVGFVPFEELTKEWKLLPKKAAKKTSKKRKA